MRPAIWLNNSWEQPYEGKTVLWSETTIGANPGEYSVFTAYFVRSASGSVIIISNILFGTAAMALYVNDSNNSMHREITINNNGITFSNGYGYTTSTGMIKHNEYLVPYAVFRNK